VNKRIRHYEKIETDSDSVKYTCFLSMQDDKNYVLIVYTIFTEQEKSFREILFRNIILIYTKSPAHAGWESDFRMNFSSVTKLMII
jgi:hypothetical protein